MERYYEEGAIGRIQGAARAWTDALYVSSGDACPGLNFRDHAKVTASLLDITSSLFSKDHALASLFLTCTTELSRSRESYRFAVGQYF